MSAVLEAADVLCDTTMQRPRESACTGHKASLSQPIDCKLHQSNGFENVADLWPAVLAPGIACE